MPKPRSTKWWSTLSCGAALWLIQVLANAVSPEAPRAWSFFSSKRDEYRVGSVLKWTSTKACLYLHWPTATIVLNSGRLHAFPLIRKNTVSVLATCVQTKHCTGRAGQGGLARKRNTRHSDWKGRSVTISIHRQHDLAFGTSEGNHTHLLELLNECCKTAGRKVNIQKSIVFLYPNNNLKRKQLHV